MARKRLMAADTDPDREPTAQELQEIEAEWPLIAAELAVVDAEIAAALSPDGTCELVRRRLRRARTQLNRQITADTNRLSPLDGVA
jgi:hypothetical protein